jgi:hypothetical protein
MEAERKYFDKKALDSEFNKIGLQLKTNVVVYLLGGGAMCFRDQKPGTKDLDLVFTTQKEFQAFSDALSESGFHEIGKLESAYEAMHASGIWQNKEGFRYDLFVKTVCNALSLSAGMLTRSKPHAVYGKLDVRIVSDEDVVLFKGITERNQDLDDIENIVSSTSVDWEIIFKECKDQSKERIWYGPLYDKLAAISQRNVPIPILDRLLKLDDMAIVREAFEAQLKKGLSRKEARAALMEREFTKEEIDEAVGTD